MTCRCQSFSAPQTAVFDAWLLVMLTSGDRVLCCGVCCRAMGPKQAQTMTGRCYALAHLSDSCALELTERQSCCHSISKPYYVSGWQRPAQHVACLCSCAWHDPSSSCSTLRRCLASMLLLNLTACPCVPVPLRRLAVFHRLYQQAVALRQKMEVRREDIKKSEIETIQQNKTTMSWISSEMMRDRSAGPFDNYGEMLYAESLESLARKRDKVGGSRLRWGPSEHLHAHSNSHSKHCTAQATHARTCTWYASVSCSTEPFEPTTCALSWCVQAQRVKAQRDMEEVQGVTFHPEISRHAQTIWGPHEVGSVPAWQRLSKGQHTRTQGLTQQKRLMLLLAPSCRMRSG